MTYPRRFPSFGAATAFAIACAAWLSLMPASATQSGTQTGAGTQTAPAKPPTPGQQPLPPQAVMDFQKKLLADLAAKAKAITGKRDAQGNLLVGDGTLTGSDISVSPTTVAGLILTRDTYVSDLDAWIAELDRVQNLPLDQKRALVRQWMESFANVGTTAVSQVFNAYQNFMTAYRDTKDVRDDVQQYYENTIKIAEELETLEKEHPGTVAVRNGWTASQYREAAANSKFGVFIAMRQRFYALLARNKLLALRKDGKYFFQALQELPIGTKLTDYMQVFNDFIDASRAEAKELRANAANVTSIEDLMKFGSARYSAQHIKAAALGSAIGATLPKLQITEVQAVFEGVRITKEENEEFWSTMGDTLLNIAMAGSILIPGGPLIAAGISVIQITRDGYDLVFSYLTEEEARKNAAVGGYQYVITSEDKTAAAKSKLFMTVTMNIPDLAVGANEIRNFRFVRGGRTATVAANTARTATAIARAAIEADPALAALAKEFGQEFAEGVVAARELGVPEGQIQDFIKGSRLEGEAASATYSDLNAMARQGYYGKTRSTELFAQIVLAAGRRRLVADMADVRDVVNAARASGVPEADIQAALAAARRKNSIAAYTTGLAADLQVAEVNARGGIVLVDDVRAEKTSAITDPRTNRELVDLYAPNVKVTRVLDVPFGVDELDAVAAKIKVAMTPNSAGVQLTREEWIVANKIASNAGSLDKFFVLNPDTGGFMQLFGSDFEATFERFLVRESYAGNPYAQATFANWTAAKQAAAARAAAAGANAAGSLPTPPTNPNPVIPAVLRDPATGGYLKPDAIAKLTKADILLLPPGYGLADQLPDDVSHPLSQRIRDLIGPPPPKAPPLGFALTPEALQADADRVAARLTRDGANAFAGSSALGGALNPGDSSKIPTTYTSNLDTYTDGDAMYVGEQIEDLIRDAGGDPKAWIKQPTSQGVVTYRAADGTTLSGTVKDGRIVVTKSGPAPAPAGSTNTPAPGVNAPVPPTRSGADRSAGAGNGSTGLAPSPMSTFGKIPPGLGSITVHQDGTLAVSPFPGAPVYTGRFASNGAIQLFAPGSNLSSTPAPAPILTTGPVFLPVDHLLMAPDGSTMYLGLDLTGLPDVVGVERTPPPAVNAILEDKLALPPVLAQTLRDDGTVAVAQAWLVDKVNAMHAAYQAASSSATPTTREKPGSGIAQAPADVEAAQAYLAALLKAKANRPRTVERSPSGAGLSQLDDEARWALIREEIRAHLSGGASNPPAPEPFTTCYLPAPSTVSFTTPTPSSAPGVVIGGDSAAVNSVGVPPPETKEGSLGWGEEDIFTRNPRPQAMPAEDTSSATDGSPDPIPIDVLNEPIGPSVSGAFVITIQTQAGTLRIVVPAFTGAHRPLSSSSPGGLWSRLLALLEPPVLAAAAPVQALFVSKGVATGDAFEVHAINDGPKTVRLSGAGVVLEPLSADAGTKARKAFDDAVRRRGVNAPPPTVASMNAYCLNYTKLPPPAGSVFRIAAPDVQARNIDSRRILAAEERLEREGRIVPDVSDRVIYGNDQKQWSVWAEAQKFSQADFAREFVDHARKNFVAAKQPWTKQTEAAVASLVAHRWAEIELIRQEAHRAGGS